MKNFEIADNASKYEYVGAYSFCFLRLLNWGLVLEGYIIGKINDNIFKNDSMNHIVVNVHVLAGGKTFGTQDTNPKF